MDIMDTTDTMDITDIMGVFKGAQEALSMEEAAEVSTVAVEEAGTGVKAGLTG